MYANKQNIANNPGVSGVKSGRAFFQPKLTVNQPGDVYEQEADHMADKVMRMTDTAVNQNAFFKPANAVVHRKCHACEEEEKQVHRKENFIYNAAPAKIQRKKENESPLEKIQGDPMYSLLPKLKDLAADVRTDEEAGNKVGGPRLVTAMRAVNAGTTWNDFVASHNGELANLPVDQVNDIMKFMGAAATARYFKSDQFGGRFDGSVDPATKVITLYFRVKFEAISAKFGNASPGTPDWDKETQEGMRQYKADFKRSVEAAWSGKGTVKPACPIAGVSAFQTKVVVTVVDSGEHKLVNIFSDGGEGRSNMSSAAGTPGNLKVGDNKPHDNKSQVVGTDGKPQQVTTTQTTAAHEFGHAIGLKHSHCDSSDDNCYGVTAEERSDIMGAGDKVQVIKRNGQIKHDDFVPFEEIGKRWGTDIATGDATKCNTWSAN